MVELNSTAKPRPAQDAFRLIPLDSYSATNNSTADRLRRRLAPILSPLMTTLKHTTQRLNGVVSPNGYVGEAYRRNRLKADTDVDKSGASGVQTATVPVTRGNSQWVSSGVTPNLVKIDVEGFE